MRRTRVGGLRVVAALLVGAVLLGGAVGCGGEEERTGTQIEWRVGTPGPDALTGGAPTAPPANPTPAPAG